MGTTTTTSSTTTNTTTTGTTTTGTGGRTFVVGYFGRATKTHDVRHIVSPDFNFDDDSSYLPPYTFL